MSASLLPRAPVVTTVALDAARDISDGSITVFGMIFANATAAALTVTVEDKDDADLFNVEVPANASVVADIIWLAQNGLGFATAAAAGMTVTVFHSQDGA